MSAAALPPATLGRRRLRALVAGPILALTLAAVPPTTARADAPWWQLSGFAGQRVSQVALVQGRLTVVAGGAAMAQATGGGFAAAPAPPPPQPASVTAGNRTWSIDAAGQVRVAVAGGPPGRDPGSPDLGAGAHLIAAPLATPGAVVAVATSGVVWRRAQDGSWSVSLVLLPDTLVTGTPAVTSLAAFSSSRQSAVVYLGTDGYGTLLSSDGGDDWLRADPGLPNDVLSLAADPAGQGEIWAGTSQGLYVHRLQPVPGIPAYAGGSLTGKWLLTAAICLVAVMLGAVGIVAWGRRWRGTPAAAS